MIPGQSQTVRGKVLLHAVEAWIQSRCRSHVRKRRKKQNAIYVDGVSFASGLMSLAG